MTVAALEPSITYKENGVSLAFPVTFRYLDPANLVVERLRMSGETVLLERGLDWDASVGDSDGGGTLTLVASEAGARLTITRRTPQRQQIDYRVTDRFPAETHERGLDKSMIIDQELQFQLDDHEFRLTVVEYGIRWFVLDPGLNVPASGNPLAPGMDPPDEDTVFDAGEF